MKYYYFFQVAVSSWRQAWRFQVPPTTGLCAVLRSSAAQGPFAYRAHQRVQA